MTITSTAFQSGERIPSQYTCDGENINPPFKIRDVPPNAQSLALIMDDPDAPRGTFVHWLIWNISPSVTSIEENSVPVTAVEGMNSGGRLGYMGPCPPSGEHRYFFRLYALDCTLDLATDSREGELAKAMEGHIIEQSELMGTYART